MSGTDRELQALRALEREAAEAGDLELARLCRVALGDEWPADDETQIRALERCVSAMRDAVAGVAGE